MPSAEAGKSGGGPWNGTYVGSGAADALPVAVGGAAGALEGAGAHAAAIERTSAPPVALRKSRRCIAQAGSVTVISSR